MSFKLEFTKGSMRVEAAIKDEALPALMEFIAKHQTDGGLPEEPKKAHHGNAGSKPPISYGGDDQISKTKAWLVKHTASEVLTLLKWQTHPEKIVLLGAYFEAG